MNPLLHSKRLLENVTFHFNTEPVIFSQALAELHYQAQPNIMFRVDLELRVDTAQQIKLLQPWFKQCGYSEIESEALLYTSNVSVWVKLQATENAIKKASETFSKEQLTVLFETGQHFNEISSAFSLLQIQARQELQDPTSTSATDAVQ